MPVQSLQDVLAPILRIIAADIENKKINHSDIDDAIDSSLSLSKSLIDSSLQDNNYRSQQGTIAVPNGIFFENSEPHVYVEGGVWLLTYDNGTFFATNKGVTKPIAYHRDHGVWEFSNKRVENTYHEEQAQDPFLPVANPELNEDRLSASYVVDTVLISTPSARAVTRVSKYKSHPPGIALLQPQVSKNYRQN